MKDNKIIIKISKILNELNSDLNIIKNTGNKTYIFFNIFSDNVNNFLFIKTSKDIFNLFIKEALKKINIYSFYECMPKEEEIFELCSFLYKI
jgi:hypothetical protein